MAWYNPSTWFKKEEATVQTYKPAVYSVTPNPTGTGGTTTEVTPASVSPPKRYTGSGGGVSSQPTPSSQPADASFTSGGDASGGGVVYDPATNSSEIKQPITQKVNLPTQSELQTNQFKQANYDLIGGTSTTYGNHFSTW